MEVTLTSEQEVLGHLEARSLLFMVSVTAPAAPPAA